MTSASGTHTLLQSGRFDGISDSVEWLGVLATPWAIEWARGTLAVLRNVEMGRHRLYEGARICRVINYDAQYVLELTE